MPFRGKGSLGSGLRPPLRNHPKGAAHNIKVQTTLRKGKDASSQQAGKPFQKLLRKTTI